MLEKNCIVAGCEGRFLARGFCNRHYKRFMRYGDASVCRIILSTEVRFWSRVNKDGGISPSSPDGLPCWEWIGTIWRNSGYARFKDGGVEVPAHRWAYLDAYGPIQNGLQLDHLCRNRRCVNPKHLEAVTGKVNVLRGETITAINHRKTHCTRGHEFSKENTFIRRNGHRRCKECTKLSAKTMRSTIEYKEKHAAYERRKRKERALCNTGTGIY